MIIKTMPIILIFLALFGFLMTHNATALMIEKHGNENATSQIVNNGTFSFEDIKNLIILIPNEAHEPPTLPQEKRLINQPYVPETAIVSEGTQIAWFNGDVGHKHRVTLADQNSKIVFDSESFLFSNTSRPLILNNIGNFSYFESNVTNADPNFVMRGTIIVRDNVASESSYLNGGQNASNIVDTVALLMVPAKDLDVHIQNIENRGVAVLDRHTFKDLRGGQEGTGQEQTLLLLATRDKPVDDIITTMNAITRILPYS